MHNLHDGLKRREIHVWWALTSGIRALNATAVLEAWLGDDETARYRRIRRAEDRELFLFTRAALRHALSQYADVPPGGWRFATAESGRPELATPFDELGLRFSVSHTPGLVACLVSHTVSGGVDVERVGRVADVSKPAAVVCSKMEREELAGLAREAARTRFYELWTLKEAYAKARGGGLRLPLSHVTFRGGGIDPVSVCFDSPADDAPARWQFELWRPSPEHQGAVAASRDPGQRYTFVYRPALGAVSG